MTMNTCVVSANDQLSEEKIRRVKFRQTEPNWWLEMKEAKQLDEPNISL